MKEEALSEAQRRSPHGCWLGGIILLLTSPIWCIPALSWWLQQDHRIAKLPLAEGIYVDFRGENFPDPLQSLSYRIRGGDSSAKEHSYFLGFLETDTRASDLHFRVLRSPSSSMLAVTEATLPKRVLILYDLENHTSWPQDFEDALTPGRAMLSELQKNPAHEELHLHIRKLHEMIAVETE